MQHDHAAPVAGARGERGAALVECALVLPFLILLVMGTVEIGRMTRSQLALAQAAREGAQAAARGLTVERINTRVLNTAEQGGLTRSGVYAVEMACSSNGGSWQALVNTTSGVENDAHRGNLVRVAVRYHHAYLTRLVFSGSQRDLVSAMVARRK